MAMSVKVEFGNESGETAAVAEDAVATGDVGGNAAAVRPASCPVDEYFKVSVETEVN